MKLLSAACLAIVASVVTAAPATARSDGSLDSGGISGDLGIVVTSPTTDGGGVPSDPRYSVVNTGVGCADDSNPALIGKIGTLYEVHYTDPATGVMSVTSMKCVYDGVPPAPPPPPPKPAEVWAHVSLGVATISTDPAGEAPTGLETRLWCDGVDRPIVLSLNLRGYNLVVTATPDRFTWKTGDGAGGTSTSPGSRDNPSVRHVYEQKGDYPVSLSIRWQGAYTLVGNGLNTMAGLGSVTSTRTAPLHVYEVRGVRG